MNQEEIKKAMAFIGRKGGLARTKNLGKEGLSRVGKLGAAARWRKGATNGLSETKSDIIQGDSDRK